LKIVVDYKEPESEFQALTIDSAKSLSDYPIRIKFSDGNEKIVDFKPFLLKSLHPPTNLPLFDHPSNQPLPEFNQTFANYAQ
jgi:hypothetical protein